MLTTFKVTELKLTPPDLQTLVSTAYPATWLQHLAVTAHDGRCRNAAARSEKAPTDVVGREATRGGAMLRQGTGEYRTRHPLMTMMAIQVLETKKNQLKLEFV